MSNALHPSRMGLEPLSLDAWLKPQPGDAALYAYRADLLAAHGASVIAALPEAASAVSEMLAFLRTRELDVAGLDDVCRAVAEDLCILTPTPQGYRLTAGVLCFPNRWKLRDKLGGNLLAVHGPVPDYAADLAAGVDRFLERLRPLRPYVRGNWGLAGVPDLYLPEPVPPVDPAKDTGFFLRRETQSFLKLPRTNAVIFTIRTNVTPWRDVPEADRTAMIETLSGLSAAWLDYKSIQPEL